MSMLSVSNSAAMADSEAALHGKSWSSFMGLQGAAAAASLGVAHSAMLHHSPHSSLRAPVAGYPPTGVAPGHGHFADMTAAAAAAYGMAAAESPATQAPFSTSGSSGGYPYSMTSRGGCGVYGLPSPPRGGVATSCGAAGGQLPFDSYYNMSTPGASLHLASAAAAAAVVRSGVLNHSELIKSVSKQLPAASFILC